MRKWSFMATSWLWLKTYFEPPGKGRLTKVPLIMYVRQPLEETSPVHLMEPNGPCANDGSSSESGYAKTKRWRVRSCPRTLAPDSLWQSLGEFVGDILEPRYLQKAPYRLLTKV